MKMEKIEFDIVKLKQFCDIDARSAIKNFASYQEFYYELDKFVRTSNQYLRKFIPSMVINNAEIRADFLTEMKKVRATLLSLDIKYPASTLSELNYEAFSGNAESLANWLLKFYTEIDHMSRNISASRVIVEDSPQAATASAAEKPVILAADDKPELLTAVVNMLEDRFKVMAATSGKAVLKVIERHSPALFLLDIEMPQMNGYELAQEIRKNAKFTGTPIIFLTSKSTGESVMSAIKSGGNDYLLKPVRKDLLLSKILLHLGSI